MITNHLNHRYDINYINSSIKFDMIVTMKVDNKHFKCKNSERDWKEKLGR